MKKIFVTSMLMLTGIVVINAQITTKTKTSSSASSAKLNQYKKEINTLYVKLEKQMNANQQIINQMRGKLDQAMKELESQNKLGNFEIQGLMSQFNQAEQLHSNVLKKIDDTQKAVIQKIGMMVGRW